VHVVEAGEHRRLTVRVGQRHVPALAGPDPGVAAHAGPTAHHGERDLAPENESLPAVSVAVSGPSTVVEPRRDRTVLGERVTEDLDVDLTLNAFDGAQHFVLGCETRPLVGLGRDGHQIEQPDRALFGSEDRLQDVRVVDVPPHACEGFLRTHGEGASSPPVQQRGEQRRTVETWQAQPVQRAVTRDQRGRATVSDDRLVDEVGTSMRRHLLRADSTKPGRDASGESR
jgi:hypothetical protein